jgi:prolyl oligopeptidase
MLSRNSVMGPLRYPAARRVEQVDIYHGTKVADPYRWMEDLDDPELAVWLARQSEITDEVLGPIPCRETFRRRIDELARLPSAGLPKQRSGRWFRTRSTGGAEYGGVYVADAVEEERKILDLTPAGSVVRDDITPSPDGTKLLWSESIGGSDWKTWHVLDVDKTEHLDGMVADAKLWATWLPDSSGFLYIAFPSDQEGASRATINPQLKRHRLGTSSSGDALVYENVDNPSYFLPSVSADGRFIVLTLLYAPGSSIAYTPVDGPYDFHTVVSSDDQLWLAGTRDDTFYVATTEGAAYGRVVAIELDDPSPESWRTVVPETDVPLPMVGHALLAGDRVMAVRDRLGRSTVSVYSLDGSDSYDIELPSECRFTFIDAYEPATVSEDGRLVYFAVSRPTSPGTIVRHDLTSRSTDIVFEPEGAPSLDTDAEVVWATSEDGTRVPMTLVRRAGSSDGSPPVVMEGYGGGGDSMQPYDYVAWKLAWLEAGGVVASAHIRGGGELGAEWQAAAARAGKLKAMQDFVACAGYLVESGYTRPELIAITGRSSGGMLAAAAAVARPELFGACVAEVGMFDPLRYHLFGMGRLMIPEYGTSEDPDDFAAMYAYSPQHNIRAGTTYPAFLLTVHTDDDRVAPGQPYKFAATLQEAQAGDAPVVLRLRSGAGHHASASTDDEVTERADILAFLGSSLSVPACTRGPSR